ncbi:MAG: hypothetical protein OXI87_09055 [Albidovulum sp.]|nr:hypothetical protein [Albidovulum sp.]MDE0532778.1 hypothetical protein [Albidovulum sp.]
MARGEKRTGAPFDEAEELLARLSKADAESHPGTLLREESGYVFCRRDGCEVLFRDASGEELPALFLRLAEPTDDAPGTWRIGIDGARVPMRKANCEAAPENGTTAAGPNTGSPRG